MRRHSLPAARVSVRASGDRWLFGYADVVTLLFACFASLYAAKISPAPVATPHHDLLLALEAQPAPADPSATLRQQLEAIIEHDAAGTSVDISTTARGLVLSLEEAGSFPAGRADLTPAATRVMLVVSNALRFLPNLIRVEGHTDDTPIRGSLFSSNWELSTARATRVVRLLSEQGAVDPSRLSAAGYAEYRPRMANDSPEARARNRRVDIVVLDVSAQQDEPAALVR